MISSTEIVGLAGQKTVDQILQDLQRLADSLPSSGGIGESETIKLQFSPEEWKRGSKYLRRLLRPKWRR